MMAPSTEEEPSMNKPISPSTGTGLRQRLIEDMSVRGFSRKTRHDYIRIIAGFTAFLHQRRTNSRGLDHQRPGDFD
jgi:integrase/recombinase XerD